MEESCASDELTQFNIRLELQQENRKVTHVRETLGLKKIFLICTSVGLHFVPILKQERTLQSNYLKFLNITGIF